MNEEKIYCGSGRIVSGKFGQIIKISLSKEDINKIVQHMNNSGSNWANLEMKEKKSPEQGKPTHYLQVDTWKPNQSAPSPSYAEPEPVSTSDDLPF